METDLQFQHIFQHSFRKKGFFLMEDGGGVLGGGGRQRKAVFVCEILVFVFAKGQSIKFVCFFNPRN